MLEINFVIAQWHSGEKDGTPAQKTQTWIRNIHVYNVKFESKKIQKMWNCSGAFGRKALIVST